MRWSGVGPRGIEERSAASSRSRHPRYGRQIVRGGSNATDRSETGTREPVLAVTQGTLDDESLGTSGNELEIRGRLQEVEDAMTFLKSVPNEQSEDVLKFIKASSDPIATLCSLHQRIQGIQRSSALSNYKVTRATFPQASQLAYELSLSHPTSYPILVPVEQIFIPVNSFSEFEARYSPVSVSNLPYATESSKPGDHFLPIDSGSAHTAPPLGGAPKSQTRFGPMPPATLVDRRLYSLRIREWTEVPIGDELAARMLSLYLETDHALLGWFDAELLITALCGGFKSGFCSPFLVSSLFYWISKAYNSIDEHAVLLGREFLQEAKARWQTVQKEDSMLTVTGCMILSIGLASDGEDGLSYMFKNEGVAMSERLRLFNVAKSASEIASDESVSANIYRARAHIAWGCYTWIVLHSSFYLEQPLELPPSFYIPENSLPYMGNTFAAVCRFRTIYAEVITVYNAKKAFVADRTSLYFVERKYHELLEWAGALDTYAQRSPSGTPHHVMVLHIWYHTAILDIFGPFINQYLVLQTFAANSTPEAISEASLMQLKCLVVEYWQLQPSALYSLMWHPSLLYIGNAVLSSPDSNADWRFYFDLCVDAYTHLYPCYHITAGFLQGLLFIAHKNGLVGATEARHILIRLFSKGRQLQAPSHVVDFGITLTAKFPAQIEFLAKRIEGLVTGRAQVEEEME